MKITRKIRNLMSILAPIARELGPLNTLHFLMVRKNLYGTKNSPESFFPKRLQGQGIEVRPGTTDLGSLQDLLTTRFYLPMWELPTNAHIVDLGGNIGTAAADFAASHPSARVITVEMDRSNYELCRRNTSTFGTRVTALHAAIWHKNETVRYDGDGEDGFHITNGSDPSRSVEGITMKELIRRFNLPRIDYLKIDIEGAERQLFQDPDLDWLTQVHTLCCEVHAPDLFALISGILEAEGFDVEKDPRHWNAIIARKPGHAAVAR
jgi:FkbM family methyltransferase